MEKNYNLNGNGAMNNSAVGSSAGRASVKTLCPQSKAEFTLVTHILQG